MTEPVELFRAFIAAEYEAVLAYHLEPKLDALRAKVKAASACMHITPANIMTIQPSGRFNELTEVQVAEAKTKMDTFRYVPRTLFLVEHYAHKTHGDLFVGYVSEKQAFDAGARTEFAGRYIATRFDGALKIFSMQSVDPFKKPSASKPDALPWTHHQGTRLSSFGKLQSATKFEAPVEARSLSYWSAR